ncbi:MAG: ABC transporter substrate-binding protein [Anaerovoracaceae bacterium]|jgi:branched-chain amino acid transport system substrate-binding protein
MKKSKSIALVLTLMLIIGALAGCGNGAGVEEGDDVIIIGLNYELTGDYAQYGKGCALGIEMAVNEINEAGGIDGKMIKIEKVDNKSDNNEAMNVATRLATQDNVVTMLGPATSGAFKATHSVADQYKIPVISCSSTANDVTVDAKGKVRDWVFRTCYNDNFQGSVMGSFAYNDLSAVKAIILSDKGNDYSQGLSESFEKTFTDLGGTIVSKEYFTAADNDFSPVLTNIKAKEYDVIFLPAYYESVGPIIKQARAAGIDAPILGADGYDSEKMLELAGSKEALNNVFFTNHYSSGDTAEDVVTFVQNFKAAHNGAEPSGFNALGYDLAYFAADAIKRAGSTDTDAIRQALAKTVDFKGVTGTFSIDENHDPVKSTVIIEFVDGVQTFKTKAGL